MIEKLKFFIEKRIENLYGWITQKAMQEFEEEFEKPFEEALNEYIIIKRREKANMAITNGDNIQALHPDWNIYIMGDNELVVCFDKNDKRYDFDKRWWNAPMIEN